MSVRCPQALESDGYAIATSKLDVCTGRLGLEQHTLKQLQGIVHKPHGIFLVINRLREDNNPYGSLAELKSDVVNILTIEDPIEYSLPGIGQTQVNNKADMTFAEVLEPYCGRTQM